MAGGTPIIQGGMSDAEFSAQLERQALENDRMLAEAAGRTADLQTELDNRDREMTSMLEQQSQRNELDLASAQKALNVELESLNEDTEEDGLKADYSALESALAKGMGGGQSGARPL